MNTEQRCARCGGELPAGAITDCCLRCALADALEEPAAEACGPTLLLDDIPRPGLARNVIGGYEVLEMIGCGGMGVVYLARQRHLDRLVALKLLPGGGFAREEAKQRFWQEAQVVAQLHHPNIVPVYESGEANGQLYFSMEYVPGRDLGEAIRAQPFHPERAARCIKTVAEALHEAHAHGILHRDLKPSNILLAAQDVPKITDFGLARRTQSTAEFTATGQLLGSPGYMAPEQVGGGSQESGVGTDVYGAGATLYALLTGRPPFSGDQPHALLQQVLTSEPISLRRLSPSVPRDLETICLKCLEKEPARRYPTAKALADDLGQFLDSKPIRARPVGPVRRAQKWCERNPLPAALLAALAIALGLGFGSTLWQWHRAVTARVDLMNQLVAVEMNQAERDFRAEAGASALARLAHAVELNPQHPAAVSRLLAALTDRNHLTPDLALGPHRADVCQVRFSPDGRQVLTHCINGDLRLWDATSGKPVTDAWQHAPDLTVLEFSPDGRRLVTASLPKDQGALAEVRIWRTKNGSPECPAIYCMGAVTDARFPTNAGPLVLLTDAGEARVWDFDSPQPAKVFQPITNATVCTLSADGRRLAVGDTAGRLTVWDVFAGRRVAGPWQITNAVEQLHFNPAGTELLSAVPAGELRLWSLASDRQLAQAQGLGSFKLVRYSGDGRHILLSGHRDAVWLDAATLQTVWRDPSKETVKMGVADSGATVLVFSEKGMRWWNPETGQPLSERVDLGRMAEECRFSADNQRVVVCNYARNALVYSLRPPAPTAEGIRQPAPVSRLATSRDGSHLATARTDGVVTVWQAETLQVVARPMDIKAQVSTLALDRRGRRLAIGTTEPALHIRDAITGTTIIAQMALAAESGLVDFSPDDRYLMAVSSNIAQVIALTDGGAKPHAEYVDEALGPAPPWGVGRIYHAEFSPDGKQFGLAGHSGSGQLWDLETGKCHHRLPHHGPVVYLSFSPDSKRVATASMDGTARVWAVDTGEPISPPLRHEQTVSSAAFARDGQSIVTTCFDGAVRLWDARSGRLLARNRLHPREILRGRVSDGGGVLLTLDRASEVLAWDTASGLALIEPLQVSNQQRPATCLTTEGKAWFSLGPGGEVRKHRWPVAPLPAPPWLAPLGYALAGQSSPADGRPGSSENLPPDELLRLRDTILGASTPGFYGDWVRRFFRAEITDPPKRLAASGEG